jgi:hypothetical protein
MTMSTGKINRFMIGIAQGDLFGRPVPIGELPAPVHAVAR